MTSEEYNRTLIEACRAAKTEGETGFMRVINEAIRKDGLKAHSEVVEASTRLVRAADAFRHLIIDPIPDDEREDFPRKWGERIARQSEELRLAILGMPSP